MRGLDPRIYDDLLRVRALQVVLARRAIIDCRVKPGNDNRKSETAAQ
jgi:hypothetical protein